MGTESVVVEWEEQDVAVEAVLYRVSAGNISAEVNRESSGECWWYATLPGGHWIRDKQDANRWETVEEALKVATTYVANISRRNAASRALAEALEPWKDA
jgi:hypothetical protein